MKTRKLKPATEISEEGGWPGPTVQPSDIPLQTGPEGEDLLCAHCETVIYPQVIDQGQFHVDGLVCPHCGGRNLLEA
jgi:DNA-directed RNA polymerase subunit RPC12/RpoP